MSRTLTNNMLQAIYSQNTDEVFVPLIKLEHADFSDIRIVADTQDLTHNGEVYTATAFTLRLPDDDDEVLPFLEWTADAVTRDLIAALRGVSDEVTATVSYVLVSDPNTVQLGPYQVELRGAEYNSQTIGGTMTIERILEEPFSRLSLTPSIAPGIF